MKYYSFRGTKLDGLFTEKYNFIIKWSSSVPDKSFKF